jgi:Fe2+ or Zn2+ uptake regulation protein
MDPHHHLSCTKCGQVFDIDYGAAQVSIQESDLARRIEHTQLWLTGRCLPCAAAS